MKKHKPFGTFNFKKFCTQITVEEFHRVMLELYDFQWRLENDYDYEVRYFLENPTIRYESRRKLLFCTINKKVSDYTLVALFYLLRNRRFDKLAYFIHTIKYYCAEHLNIYIVEVIYRFKPADDILAVFKERIEELYNKKVLLVYKKAPAILGGFKLRWVTGEIDFSISKQINDLVKHITLGRSSYA